jgi:hypothetical protein
MICPPCGRPPTTFSRQKVLSMILESSQLRGNVKDTSGIPQLELEVPVPHVEGAAVVVQPHRALPVRRLREGVIHEPPAKKDHHPWCV